MCKMRLRTMGWLRLMAFAFVLLWATPTLAIDLYGNLEGGWSHLFCTICRGNNAGTWAQPGLPEDIYRDRLGWKAGLGLQFTEDWGAEVNVVDAGTIKIRLHNTVADDKYNKDAHACLPGCVNLGEFDTDDHYRGLEAALVRSFQVDVYKLRVKLGSAVFHHNLQARYSGNTINMRGTVPMPMLGVELGYGWLKTAVTYYHGIGGYTEWSAGLPVSKEIIMWTWGFRFN